MKISVYHGFGSKLGEKAIPFIKPPLDGNVKVAASRGLTDGKGFQSYRFYVLGKVCGSRRM